MERTLPTVLIYDTTFYVNTEGMQFTQVDDPSNSISFAQVQDNGSHLMIIYDTRTKNAFQGTWGEMSSTSAVVPVRLPSIYELDPEGIARLKERGDKMGILDGAAKVLNDLKRIREAGRKQNRKKH